MTSMGIIAKHLHDCCVEKQTVFVTLPEIKIGETCNQIEEFNIGYYLLE